MKMTEEADSITVLSPQKHKSGMEKRLDLRVRDLDAVLSAGSEYAGVKGRLAGPQTKESPVIHVHTLRESSTPLKGTSSRSTRPPGQTTEAKQFSSRIQPDKTPNVSTISRAEVKPPVEPTPPSDRTQEPLLLVVRNGKHKTGESNLNSRSVPRHPQEPVYSPVYDDDENIKCTGCFTRFPCCAAINEDETQMVKKDLTAEERLQKMVKKDLTAEERLQYLEQYYNIKLDDSSTSGRLNNNIVDASLSTCLLFLSVLVLLLLLTFLTFRLSARVESLEVVCSSLTEYLQLISQNRTETTVTEQRKNPGIIKGKRKSRIGKTPT